MTRRALLAVLLGIALAACASHEILQPKGVAVPTGVNLSGNWQLRTDVDEQQRRINAAIRQTGGVDDSALELPLPPREGQAAVPPRRARGGLVYVFLQNGRRLKITQTDAGLFISFDRAVVQEYRFGENREVRIGPVIADRVSGWEGRQYVAETLDEKNMKLTERFALQQDGQVLLRTITLRGRNKDEKTVFQTFDRVR